MGKWNGLGGKVQPGESIIDAAKREAFEEAGIEVLDPVEVGVMDFEFVGDPVILEVHVFRANKFAGEPVETEEMKPQWYGTDEIPYEHMCLDDRHWLPLFLAGRKFTGKFLFEGQSKILKHELTIV